MKPIIPSGEFPENVKPAKFTAPDEIKDHVNDIVGLMHQDQEGNTVALEFMFEVTEQELHTLKHEPFVTLTLFTSDLSPFALQTSYPFEDKYTQLNSHTHICTSKEESHWWKCDNPRHDPIKDRTRECDECWRERTQNV